MPVVSMVWFVLCTVVGRLMCDVGGCVQLERALELSADMQRRGVQRNVHTHSALMNVCIKCGQLKLALDVWEDMQRDGIVPNVVRS